LEHAEHVLGRYLQHEMYTTWRLYQWE